MSILIIMTAGAILLTVFDAVEAIFTHWWKRTHYKRTFVNGGWKL